MNKRQRKKITKKQVREARTLGQARAMGIGGDAAKYATPNPRDEELRKIGYDDAVAGKEARSFATMYDIGYKEGLKSKKEKPMSKYDFFKENKMNIKNIIKEELQNFLTETEASKCKQMLDNGEISPDQYKACVDQYEKDYGEVEDTGSRAMYENRLARIIREEAQKYLTEWDASRFPLKLSAVKPDVAKVVATSGLKDKKEEDDKINVTPKPSGVASVQSLKPSQSSMNIQKAMTFALHMIDHPAGKMDPGGDLGAFISKDDYIMDGHHRWIATAMVDPSKPVGGFLVDFPAEQLVAILNAMTKGRYGVMGGKPASGGFGQFKEAPIRKQLYAMAKGGISKETAPETFDPKWQGMSPEQVVKALEAFTGKTGKDAVEASVTKMVNNLGGITMSTPSWAPARPDMPVIDKPNVADAVKALETGEVDWAKPTVG